VIEIERERERERERSVWFPTDTHREKVERERICVIGDSTGRRKLLETKIKTLMLCITGINNTLNYN
jgi:hypothetical protein